MTAAPALRHALVISPTPSHGSHQGNSTRIQGLTAGLQRLGYRVHFLYFALDGQDRGAIAQMQHSWDSLDVIPARAPEPLVGRAEYGIDDWCGEPVRWATAEALRARRYDLVLVNYVWLSGCLDLVPPGTCRLIDTHDRFGGRAERARQSGLQPSWFWTSDAEEQRGLSRADCVIAIQPDEAAHFSALIGPDRVATVGHLAAPCFLPPRQRSGRLRLGLLGSGNPWNVAALRAFASAAARTPGFQEAVELVIGGAVCAAAGELPVRATRLGTVGDVARFYGDLDCVVNPAGGGTGLKIKSVEALQYGKPLIAVQTAMTGLGEHEPEQACLSVEQLASQAVALAADPQRLLALGAAARAAFGRYAQQQHEALAVAVDVAADVALKRAQTV